MAVMQPRDYSHNFCTTVEEESINCSLLPRELSDKAVVILDQNGIILVATSAAAALLARPVEELTGFPFGVMPPYPLRAHLDVIAANGARRLLRACAIPSESSTNREVIQLEDCTQSMPLSESVALALSDIAPAIESDQITLRVHCCPPGNCHPSLRRLLADCMCRFVQVMSPRAETMEISTWLSCGYVAISVSLPASRMRPAHPSAAQFASTLNRVNAAGGYLDLEYLDLGLGLRLIMPLSQTSPSA